MDETHTTRPLGYQPALDGLRAVAVLAVFGFHAAPARLPGGYVGVDLFFVLSGFLITTLLLEEKDRTKRVALAAFYVRRALRLLPALVVFLACYVVCYGLQTGDWPFALASAGVAIVYLSNWVRALGLSGLGWVGHTWSLSNEEQFYLLWPPLLLLLGYFLRSKAAVLLAVAAAAFGVMAYRALGALNGWPPARLYDALDTRADGLLIGCCLAFIYNRNVLGRCPRLKRLVGGAGALSLVGLVAFCLFGLARLAPVMLSYGYALASLAAGLVVMALASEAPGARGLACLLRLPPLVWVGKVSYGVYLWHSLAIYSLKESLPGLSPWLSLPLALAATLAVAGLSFALVERPFLRLKKRFTPGAGAGAARPPVGGSGMRRQAARTLASWAS
jgi:peptidoglycan/LPS O-acetylase OafA/YrhL